MRPSTSKCLVKPAAGGNTILIFSSCSGIILGGISASGVEVRLIGVVWRASMHGQAGDD